MVSGSIRPVTNGIVRADGPNTRSSRTTKETRLNVPSLAIKMRLENRQGETNKNERETDTAMMTPVSVSMKSDTEIATANDNNHVQLRGAASHRASRAAQIVSMGYRRTNELGSEKWRSV